MSAALTEVQESSVSVLDRRHPDIFTAEEAAAYLHLDNARSLEALREKYGLIGHRPAGKCYLYHREDLDACALKMFGKDKVPGSPRRK